MRQALTRAYPPGSSSLRRALGPAVDPWTYGRVLHLLAMFPLGVVYFVVLVTALSVGLALGWTIVGPPVLLVAMYLSRWAGDAEAWAVRNLHGMELRRPPTTIERGHLRSQVWQRVSDPTTWTGLVYLFVQFPVGLVAFVFLVTATSVGVVFAVSPLVVGPNSVIDFGAGSRWVIDEPAEAWWLPFVGLAVLLLELHAVNLLSATHAWWARLMLGSRAPHITPGAPLEPIAPAPSGPEGGAADLGDAASAERATRLVESDIRLSQAREAATETHRSPPAPPMPATRLDEASAAALASLTPREHEVLRLLARGYSNAEIAEAFVVSEGTVKTHVKRVLSKLDVRDRTQAAVWAYNHRVVEPTSMTATAVEAALEPVRLRSPR